MVRLGVEIHALRVVRYTPIRLARLQLPDQP